MSDGIVQQKTEALVQARKVRFRIAGHVVRQAVVSLPDDQRGAILWLHDHIADLDLDIAGAGQLVKLEADDLTAVFTGKYSGALAPVVKRVEALRKHWTRQTRQAADGEKLGFIPNSQARELWQICDKARLYQKWAFIFGETQRGKTTVLQEYGGEHCDEPLPHGSVVFTSVPTGGSLPHYLHLLATQLRIPTQQKQYILRTKIMSAFDPKMLLIVDELHQCVMGRDRGNGCRTVEFIRELSDRRGCGVVVSATNIFQEAMDHGAVAGILKQVAARQIITKQLEPPPEEDLNLFSAAYGLKPPTGEALQLQTETVNTALGLWLTLLRMAANLARSKKEPLTWDIVRRANLGLKALAGKKPAGKDGAK